jgi:hypothetical protein
VHDQGSAGALAVDGGGQRRRSVDDDQVPGVEEVCEAIESCMLDRAGASDEHANLIALQTARLRRFGCRKLDGKLRWRACFRGFQDATRNSLAR